MFIGVCVVCMGLCLCVRVCLCVSLAPPPHLPSQYPLWATSGSTLTSTSRLLPTAAPWHPPNPHSLPPPLPPPIPSWEAPSLPLTGTSLLGVITSRFSSWGCCCLYPKRLFPLATTDLGVRGPCPLRHLPRCAPFLPKAKKSLNSRTAQSEACGSPSVGSGVGVPASPEVAGLNCRVYETDHLRSGQG